MSANQPSEMTILEQALTFASTDARAAYLQRACGGDEPLRARVVSLIEAHEAAGGFLPDKAAQSARTVRAELRPNEGEGTVIDRYKLLQKIGEGGCGVVYMADQEEPVRRRVARGFVAQERPAVFGGKDEMNVNGGKGLWHGGRMPNRKRYASAKVNLANTIR